MGWECFAVLEEGGEVVEVGWRWVSERGDIRGMFMEYFLSEM